MHTFTAKIELLDFGRIGYHVAYLPPRLADKLSLKPKPRPRIAAKIGEQMLNAGLQPSAKGWFIMLSNRLLKEEGFQLGDDIRIEFSMADPNQVDVPDELIIALRRHPRAQAAWNRLTPGRQRGLVHMVNTAKREETREKRILSLLDDLVD